MLREQRNKKLEYNHSKKWNCDTCMTPPVQIERHSLFKIAAKILNEEKINSL